ncbi:MAG: hypothetical protein EBZ77_13945, partial [Chitinophagia bacterium]|nr:hypothetical protein [Chitinophagia bacterium]
MNENKSIKNWLEDDRPREKMLRKGPASLSDAELLAILIASGTREKSALDLARETLSLAKNNLRELGRITIKEMQKVKGVGEARAVTIAAAMELGRRRQIADGLERPVIRGTSDAVNIIRPLLEDRNEETFCAIYLNSASKVLHYELLTTGGITSTVVD